MNNEKKDKRELIRRVDYAAVRNCRDNCVVCDLSENTIKNFVSIWPRKIISCYIKFRFATRFLGLLFSNPNEIRKLMRQALNYFLTLRFFKNAFLMLAQRLYAKMEKVSLNHLNNIPHTIRQIRFIQT
jgi:hypothetical protein